MRHASFIFCSFSTFALLAACGQSEDRTLDVETRALAHLMAGPGHGGGQQPSDPNWGHDPNQVGNANGLSGDPNQGGSFPGGAGGNSNQAGGNPNQDGGFPGGQGGDPNGAGGQGGGYPGGHGGNPNAGGHQDGGGYPGGHGGPNRGGDHSGDPNQMGGQAGEPNQAGDPNWGGGDPNGMGGQVGSRGAGRGLHPACASLFVALNAAEHALAGTVEFNAWNTDAPHGDASVDTVASEVNKALSAGVMSTRAWFVYLFHYETAARAGCLD